jgi:hypothetical protein
MPLILTGTSGSTTLDSSAGLTFSDSSNQAAAASPFGLKNRIINGDMVIDQRNNGASVTPSTSADTYTVDRWTYTGSATSKCSIQQSTTAPSGFKNSVLITSLSAYTPGSSDYILYSQFIEGLNTYDLAWGTASAQTVTLSFWVRSSLTGTFGGAIRNSAFDRSYPFSYTISNANTWEKKAITIAGDTTGTWLTTNGVGLRVNFDLGSGSTFKGTANTWASANYLGVTGGTNLVATNGATFYVTGVQLERNTTATPFEWIPYGTELALCQRYFYALEGGGNINYAWGSSVSTSLALAPIYPPVRMRTTPTSITSTNPRVFNINTGVVVTSGTYALNSNSSSTVITLEYNQVGAFSNAQLVIMNNNSGTLGFSAEL